MLPPPNWEYLKPPWYFGLVVKIFRRDPQLALDVADVMTDLSNVPLSRAELKRRKQEDAHLGSGKKKALSNSVTEESSPLSGGDWKTDPCPSVVSSTNVDNRADSVMAMAAENQERFASAKMLSSKAQAGTYNIGVRMAVMEELERGLNILDRIRGCIGEEKFSEGVQDVYESLPKYATFKNEVKVIDVDNDDTPFKNEVKVIDVDNDDPPIGSASAGTATKEANDDSGIVESDDEDDLYDSDGGIDLEKMYPNTEDNNVQYIYTRNATGRVISVDCRLKKGRKGTK